MEGMSRYLKDLDLQLEETLATVTAEAMACDVIHQVYIPQLEPCCVKDILVRSSADSANKKGFPLVVEPDMPNLLLDPQLIRYIHRNAVSNAVKYGRTGGVIEMVARYNAETPYFPSRWSTSRALDMKKSGHWDRRRLSPSFKKDDDCILISKKRPPPRLQETRRT
jgi:signal transduction histidine kinase